VNLTQPDHMLGAARSSTACHRVPTIRRARRKDSLLALLRARTIEPYHVEAAERLRADMEASSPSMPGALRFGVHVAPFQVTGIAERHLAAAKSVRKAFAAIGADALPVVDCILRGSTITEGVSRNWWDHAAIATAASGRPTGSNR